MYGSFKKNDGTLPLKETGKLALYGNGARRTIKGGSGSGDVNVRHFVTVEEGLENAGFEITTKKLAPVIHGRSLIGKNKNILRESVSGQIRWEQIR